MDQPRISVAPMMEVTDRHFRRLARLLSKSIVLYTEMVVSSTILHNLDKLDRFLGFDEVEKPIVLQLGGNNPEDLAKCAKIAQDMGYDEVNINCGCPSSRVAGNEFGASLMLKPELVREIFTSMQAAVNIPVTIKCRLGCDNQERYQHIYNFITAIPECKHFIIHARNCILKGLKLTPTQNRSIPPLKPHYVFRLVQDFPDVKIEFNGQVKNIKEARELFSENEGLFGVMIGRAAWHNLSILSEVEEGNDVTRREVMNQYLEYCYENRGKYKSTALMKPLQGLATNCSNAKKFRGLISQCNIKTHLRSTDYKQVGKVAMKVLDDEFLDTPIRQTLEDLKKENTKS